MLALPRASAPEEVDDGQQDDGPEQRDHQAAQAEVALVDGSSAYQGGNQPSRQQGADDAYDDIQPDALLGIRIHDSAREPSNQAPYNQPDNDVHSFPRASRTLRDEVRNFHTHPGACRTWDTPAAAAPLAMAIPSTTGPWARPGSRPGGRKSPLSGRFRHTCKPHRPMGP